MISLQHGQLQAKQWNTNRTLQKQAAIAMIEAGNDTRLRCARLRKHQAVQYTKRRQTVYLWRQGPGGPSRQHKLDHTWHHTVASDTDSLQRAGTALQHWTRSGAEAPHYTLTCHTATR